jgi:CheY-like chemotaxis protein
MTFPKRPSTPPGQRPAQAPGQRPSQAPLPPGVRSTIPSVRPGNVRDALTEAQAISGGGLTRPSTRPASFAPLAKKVVLLVDSDAAMRAKLKQALSPFYDVIEAQDGMEAVEMAATIAPPALIVSDVVMPRVDGFTLAKTLRNNPAMKKVPIMFVSSRNNPQDVTQALVIGACHFFQKTAPVSEIVSKIRKIVV